MPTDAAALPSPPDIPPWKSGTRPYSVGGNLHSNDYYGQVTRPDSYKNGTRSSIHPKYPNIKDLQDQAASSSVNETEPVSMGIIRGGDRLAHLIHTARGPPWNRRRSNRSCQETGRNQT